MTEDPWYAERRARWKPDHVRLLLIAESAPDDKGDTANRRFFYDETLTSKDGLFRETVRALYGNLRLTTGPFGKTPWLERLQADGVFLIDLAVVPVNYHSPAERLAMLKQNVDTTVALSRQLNPDGIVLIKRNVFELLQHPLQTTGLPLLHSEMIPFPGSGQQKRFRAGFTSALYRLSARR